MTKSHPEGISELFRRRISRMRRRTRLRTTAFPTAFFTLDPKRLCRPFSYCTALMRAKHNDLGQFATGCPPFDKEVYGPIWQRAKKGPKDTG